MAEERPAALPVVALQGEQEARTGSGLGLSGVGCGLFGSGVAPLMALLVLGYHS